MDTYSEAAHSDEFYDDDTSDGLGVGLRGSLDADELAQNTFAHTAFDAYFAQNHKPSRTSANVFSDILTPLTAQEYTHALASSKHARLVKVPWLADGSRKVLFPRLFFELNQGFNLLFYGAGSKRAILNALAVQLNEKNEDVLVINAFNPAFTIKDLLTSIENIPAMEDCPPSLGSGTEAQLRRIQKFFSSQEEDNDLSLVIHNIDAPSLRSARAKSCLTALAACPRIHILASVDNIAFPTLWSLTEAFTRKSDRSSTPSMHAAPSPGCAWLFHDLTTLAPYDFELTYADRSSISGGSQATKASRMQKEVPGTSATAIMTEDAARHILLSVTQKAKKLFVLLGTKQLEAMEDLDAASTDPKQLAYDYGMLFNMARDDFVATNDTALRALMGEFKDHGLMMSIVLGVGGAEAVWIPLRKEALTKIVNDLRKKQG